MGRGEKESFLLKRMGEEGAGFGVFIPSLEMEMSLSLSPSLLRACGVLSCRGGRQGRLPKGINTLLHFFFF